MSRPLRIEFPGAIYPLTSLGNARQSVFIDDEEKIIPCAYVRYGYTMKEIADQSGFHYATVSRAIKRAEEGRKFKV